MLRNDGDGLHTSNTSRTNQLVRTNRRGLLRPRRYVCVDCPQARLRRSHRPHRLLRGHRRRARRIAHRHRRADARGAAEQSADVSRDDRKAGEVHGRIHEGRLLLRSLLLDHLARDHRRHRLRGLQSLWRRWRVSSGSVDHGVRLDADDDQGSARYGAAAGEEVDLAGHAEESHCFEHRILHQHEGAPGAGDVSLELRSLLDLVPRAPDDRLRGDVALLAHEVRGDHRLALGRGRVLPGRGSGAAGDGRTESAVTVAGKRTAIVIAALVILGLIIFFSVRGSGGETEKVYAEAARRQKIEATVTAPGEVDPKFKVNISAHVIGKIEHLYFNEGDTVAKGQKLIELEKPSFLAARDNVRAQLEARRVEVARARAALETAQVAYDRVVKLRDQGIQAQEAFDQARLNLENARAAYRAAQQGVQQGSATIVQAETDLSYTTITSPTTGKVVQLNAREGEVVIPGTMNNPGSVLAVIADM